MNHFDAQYINLGVFGVQQFILVKKTIGFPLVKDLKMTNHNLKYMFYMILAIYEPILMPNTSIWGFSESSSSLL